MPTYQYECVACSHTFDILQSMSEKRLRKCPACGKLKLVRLIGTGTGIIFKGSGFYETDYKKKEAPASKPEQSPAEPVSKPPESKEPSSKTGAKS